MSGPKASKESRDYWTTDLTIDNISTVSFPIE